MFDSKWKRMHLFEQSIVAFLLLLIGANGVIPQEPDGDPVVLDQKTVPQWRAHILPTQEELAWQQIDWLSDLQSGIDQAAKSNKPILLWTMNGHPLGCT